MSNETTFLIHRDVAAMLVLISDKAGADAALAWFVDVPAEEMFAKVASRQFLAVYDPAWTNIKINGLVMSSQSIVTVRESWIEEVGEEDSVEKPRTELRQRGPVKLIRTAVGNDLFKAAIDTLGSKSTPS